jgi:ubiquinone/menaquinone biosynthesis C-methylase UbiE
MTKDSPYQDEQTAKNYETYYETKYLRAGKLEKQFLTKLISQFQQPKTLLEVGCGTAHFTRWIDSSGVESYGVDTSSAMLREAKARWINSRLVQSEGSHLPFKDKSVDLIIYITSLEYMPNIASAFLEARRVAKKGLIVGLINKNSPSNFRKKLQSRSSFYKKAHFYSISDIKKALDEAFQGEYRILFWSTTVFPQVLGNLESSRLPFGAFLGISIELRDTA